MKKWPMLLLIALLSLTALSAVAGEKKVHLNCRDVENKFPPVTLYNDSGVPFVEYDFRGTKWLTKLEAISGAELMGTEGSWLIFFEFFQHSGQYLLTVIETSEFEVIAGITLHCEKP